MENKKIQRVLTGLQPSGSPQLGNYFGAILPAIQLGQQYELFLFMADLHTLNTKMPPAENRKNSLDLAATLLACGLDPSKSVFFPQSAVSEVGELMWYLSCQAPFGLLSRAHAFKDKQAKNVEVNCGLFNYPILMAADILLYDANLVPVGQDQKQHLEMARDLAIRFNNQYGELLVVPEPLISDGVGVVPGTDGEKMSKSKNNVISIFATDKVWKSQVMSVKTDSKGLDEPKDPETCVVFQIFKLLGTAAEAEDMASRYRAGGYGYGHAKLALLEKVKERFTPMREAYDRWMARPDDLCDVLRSGSIKAREIARKKIEILHDALGLLS